MLSKTAVIYCRVSSDEQADGYSLATQEEGCRAFCDREGYEILEVVAGAESSKTTSRPLLWEALARAKDHGADVLVVWKSDRLVGRGSKQKRNFVKYRVLKAVPRVHYALDGGGFARNEDGLHELMNEIEEYFAWEENQRRIEGSRRGKRGRLEAGYPIVSGVGCPYGYRYVPGHRSGHLEVVEEEVAIVRDMYRWIAIDGLSSYGVAERLHALGVPTRGDQRRSAGKRTRKRRGATVWSPTTVRQMILNTVYKGEWIFNTTRRVEREVMVKPDGTRYKTEHVQVPTDPSEWIRVPVPAIVDEDLWERARAQFALNKKFSKPSGVPYLLRGMVICGCGQLRKGTHYYKGGKTHAYYRCISANAKPWQRACETTRNLRRDVLDRAVWRFVTDYLTSPEQLERDLARRAEEEAEVRRRCEGQVAAREADLARVDDRLGQLLTLELDGYPAQVVAQERDRLVAERRDLAAGLENVKREMRLALPDPADEAKLAWLAEQFHVLGTPDGRPDLGAAVLRMRIPTTLEGKRALLRSLRLKVTVIDDERVEVSGVMSAEILNILSGSEK